MAIVFFCIYWGTASLTMMMLCFGVLIIDEVYCNILSRNRLEVYYFVTQGIFVAPYLVYNFSRFLTIPSEVTMYTALAVNIVLLAYLFFIDIKSNLIKSVREWVPFLIAIMVLLPWLNISLLYRYENWRSLIFIMLLINFGMDTGAWFFGKKFGKRKLWEKVSPKKTIEGLIGGALCSSILGSLAWNYFVGDISPYLIILFSLLGILSQFGDLIQSKIKRQTDVKDASGLIPGHGGVYDRLDSLLFLSPFFVIMVNFYYS
jgi:phosphatidate cytidylyltransferase